MPVILKKKLFIFHHQNPLYITSNQTYPKNSNISRTLVGNRIVNNSDVVGESPVSAAATTSSLGKDNCKMRQEAFKFWGFCVTYTRGFTVRYILEGLNNDK